jgi:Domain of Unknown Function (DUF928)
MIFNLRLLPTVVGITISLGVAWPLLLGQQYLAIGKSTTTKKFKVRRPPPPPSSADMRGFPGGREAAINRACSIAAGARLVALAPEFVKTEGGERSVWGQTTQANPTLWFFVAAVDRSAPLEFFLQDRDDNVIYESVIPAPVKDGVIGVKIPQGQKPLVIDRPYRWTLKAKFGCGESTPEQRYVDGWIQRVGLPAGIDVVSNPAQVYVDRGIWYDAVNSLAEQRLKEPRNVQLRQDWRELLGAMKLEEFAVQPLIK